MNTSRSVRAAIIWRAEKSMNPLTVDRVKAKAVENTAG